MGFFDNHRVAKQHGKWCEKAAYINCLMADVPKHLRPKDIPLGGNIVDYALDRLAKEMCDFAAPPMPKVKPPKNERKLHVYYESSVDFLEKRLNAIKGDVISVTWQGVPHSRFVIVWRE